ncbi:hypothetical protein EXS71_01485 [Candidatus Uhrbacteria bacterium]|nr:hypothetical protein [Candidatus Uhrbacteria bacterium]
MKKSIELEVRGEIKKTEIPGLEARLKALGFRSIGETRRTSVMSFGDVSMFDRDKKRHGGPSFTQVDNRCRITNSECEVVTKIGLTHASNRLEIGQQVDFKSFLTFAQMFASMGFFTKVGSKLTKNFQRKSISVALVQSPSGLAYIEIEKMTDRTQEKKDLKELTTLARQLEIKLWGTRKQFLDFCKKLTDRDDWQFRGTAKNLIRLKKEIRQAGSDRNSHSVIASEV